ncbi:hypothetical protein GN330_22520 [Nitratireductor sp. CAU 1489]|uniref:Uncharacterized protein n=1 Tax=Nitratireductor arenosus TaxID=2682096 RepID=A0A844QR24_9HYPH|nr:hypothetical protein [Nitratireductor arenosus]MVB00030.1 hypothetical protein [Nitratireductor arenosus]
MIDAFRHLVLWLQSNNIDPSNVKVTLAFSEPGDRVAATTALYKDTRWLMHELPIDIGSATRGIIHGVRFETTTPQAHSNGNGGGVGPY